MTIKEAIKEIFDVVNAYIAAKDQTGPSGSEVNLIEKIKIGIQGLDLVKVATGYQQLVDDWKSRDTEKINAWKEAFAENFDLTNEELEEIIENLVNRMVELANDFVKLSKKKK